MEYWVIVGQKTTRRFNVQIIRGKKTEIEIRLKIMAFAIYVSERKFRVPLLTETETSVNRRKLSK